MAKVFYKLKTLIFQSILYKTSLYNHPVKVRRRTDKLFHKIGRLFCTPK